MVSDIAPGPAWHSAWWATEWKDGDTETITLASGIVATYTFSEARARHVVYFFERFLHHSKDPFAGKRFKLEDWQRRALRTLFGWLRADGSRRFRTLFLFLPRKNGKSTLAAGIALYLTFADFERGAEVYSAATDREQAEIVFGEAQSMVLASPDLLRLAQVFKKAILSTETGARYKVLSSEVKSKHGFNSHGAIIDELHAHPNRDLFDVLVTSMGTRRQPMTIITTTAGVDRHSVCYEQYNYAREVQAGNVIDPSYLAVLFEAAPGDDWHAEATWYAANPNLGVTVQIDYLRAEHQKATEIPGYENTFRRLYLNQWTEQAKRWLSMDLWNRNAGPARDEAYWNALKGRPIYLAVDLSATKDLAAVVGVIPNDDRTRFAVIAKAFIPDETIRVRSRRDKVPYETWAREGWITRTNGRATDQKAVFAAVLDFAKTYEVKECACDRWEAQRFMQDLDDEGVNVFAMGLGYVSMSEPSKALERHLLADQIEHGENPVLSWCIGNIAIDTDPAGNIKPAKNRSADRIDLGVALIMALGRSILERVEENRLIYDTPGGRRLTL